VRFQRCAAFEPSLLKSGFGQGQAITTVIGPFEKGVVDRRWPACISIFILLIISLV
jgi:hypothetical protein